MAVNYQKKIVTDGLVLCLDAGDVKSYPGSGTVWYDRSGNGNDGSLVNGVGFSNGAMVFDGVNDYIDCGSRCDVSSTNQFTLDFWAVIKSGALSSLKGIICKANSATAGQWYCILDATTGQQGKIVLRVADGTLYEGYRTQLPYNDNILRHYVFTWKPGIFNCYINSIETTMQFELGNPVSMLNSSSVNVNIGRRGTGAGSANYFNGDIYSVKFYNRVLSQQEVLQNYNAQKGRFGL